jgi:hypothetical protein
VARAFWALSAIRSSSVCPLWPNSQWPALLQDLERNWTLIGQGQVWRLLTSLVVQDGGIIGAATIGAVLGAVLAPHRVGERT